MRIWTITRFSLAALLELMQAAFRPQDLAGRSSWPTRCSSDSRTDALGGFFFTSHDHEPLIHRGKPGHDNATPAGNGVAAQALLALGHWVGDTAVPDRGGTCGPPFRTGLLAQPSGFASLAVALEHLSATADDRAPAGRRRHLRRLAAGAAAALSARVGRPRRFGTTASARSAREATSSARRERHRHGYARERLPAAASEPRRDRRGDRRGTAQWRTDRGGGAAARQSGTMAADTYRFRRLHETPMSWFLPRDGSWPTPPAPRWTTPPPRR